MPRDYLTIAQVGLLVLAGGSFAWLTQMAGVLVWPRGLEKVAVAAAGQAVAGFAEAIGTADEDRLRHTAAWPCTNPGPCW